MITFITALLGSFLGMVLGIIVGIALVVFNIPRSILDESQAKEAAYTKRPQRTMPHRRVSQRV